MPPFQLLDRLPTVEEHDALFVAVGWGPYARPAAEIALRGSLFGVVAVEGERVIGMGRIVGDGGKFFYIQDLAVHPDRQHQGVGRMIFERLLAWIRVNAPHDPFVGLFATPMAVELYRGYGLDPHLGEMIGMWTVLPVDNIGWETQQKPPASPAI